MCLILSPQSVELLCRGAERSLAAAEDNHACSPRLYESGRNCKSNSV